MPRALTSAGVWSSVALTLVIQSLVSLVVFAPPVLAPAAQVDIGVPAASVGVATALIYTGAVFSALLSSTLIARFGPLRVSQFALAVCATGIALIAAGRPLLVALGALVIGIGYGPVTPSSSAILAERVPPRLRALIFSIKQTGVPIGGALAGALIPVLIVELGWRVAAVLVAVLCLILVLVVHPWRRAVDGSDMAGYKAIKPSLIAPLRLVLAHPGLREMALASFAFSGMQMCLGSFLVVYLHERAGFSVAAAGAALSAAMLAGVAGRVFWGIVADNWVGPRRLLGLLGTAMSLAAFLIATVDSTWPIGLVLFLSVVYGATAVGWNGVYLSEVARIAPGGQAAAATGGSVAMTYCGVVALPLLFWFIVSMTGSYAASFIAVGALTLWRASFFLLSPVRPAL
ncbi:MAG TPA: MFS transporter [Burkholderiales bacterium]|nr:MFS transporter [Burkholderiales bacterium]